jgi:phosphoribosylamine-glycine ligase
MLTAGNYVVVVTGAGETVTAAHNAAYAVVGDVKWPSNVMYRTDIGKRLEAQLPVLHKLGYAKGITYG